MSDPQVTQAVDRALGQLLPLHKYEEFLQLLTHRAVLSLCEHKGETFTSGYLKGVSYALDRQQEGRQK